MTGKGSKRRDEDYTSYANNYDHIDWHQIHKHGSSATQPEEMELANDIVTPLENEQGQYSSSLSNQEENIKDAS